MKLVIGLGNPGDKYSLTRHNAGFLALDNLIKDLGLKAGGFKLENKFNALVFDAGNADYSDRILFVKPQTFMNDSGKAVAALVHFYKANPQTDLLVLHDEVDLPFGRIKTTGSSTSAGNNGVQSIIDQLGTQDFQRIRIGIEQRGSRAELPTDAFVLSKFSDEELSTLESEIFPGVIKKAKEFMQKK